MTNTDVVFIRLTNHLALFDFGIAPNEFPLDFANTFACACFNEFNFRFFGVSAVGSFFGVKKALNVGGDRNGHFT